MNEVTRMKVRLINPPIAPIQTDALLFCLRPKIIPTNANIGEVPTEKSMTNLINENGITYVNKGKRKKSSASRIGPINDVIEKDREIGYFFLFSSGDRIQPSFRVYILFFRF